MLLHHMYSLSSRYHLTIIQRQVPFKARRVQIKFKSLWCQECDSGVSLGPETFWKSGTHTHCVFSQQLIVPVFQSTAGAAHQPSHPVTFNQMCPMLQENSCVGDCDYSNMFQLNTNESVY